MNSLSDDREYYCSMYPGALSGYHYIDCIDLALNVFTDGKIYTTQALNKFREDQLEFFDIKKERTRKIQQIQNKEK